MYQVNRQKYIVFLYTSNEQLENLIKYNKKVPFIKAQKNPSNKFHRRWPRPLYRKL